MKKDLMDVSLSPEAINEVTVGSSELPVLPDSAEDKKSEDHQQQDKEKKKGMLTGEAYSRAVDRSRLNNHHHRVCVSLKRVFPVVVQVAQGGERVSGPAGG